MNPVDVAMTTFLNQFARHSQLFDSLMVLLETNELLKGGLFMTLLWWYWFRQDHERDRSRDYIVPTVLLACVAVLLTRGIVAFLPFRTRPLHTPALHFLLPFAMNPRTLLGWSSFPSDHAVLFFALATGLFCISRQTGRWAALYVAVVICWPRLYLGIHWLTDILAGALIGVAMGALVLLPGIRATINRPCEQLRHTAPGAFYAGLFLLTTETMMLFDGVRHILVFAYHTFGPLHTLAQP
jgi:undecaprenyl-diphosphatase